jgi:ABC-2 type transport system ATP-binding protein
MSGPALVLEDVRRAFGGKAVLRGVTARAERGRVIGLLGRNGEGKTTLFKILLDLLAADSGRVEVLGLVPDGSAALRAKVGWIPERPQFHDFMTAADVLELRAKLFPRWSSERAAAAAKRLGLDLSVGIAGASKGTLGKLAWVCAVAHDPELLLLDEPTSGLDALVREELLESLVGELHDSGKTILVANHRMEELGGLLDEVWLLADGRIAAVHEVEALRSGARRLRGRLKTGGIEECSALDEAGVRAAAGRFEAFEEMPLPLKDTLALLLKEGSR